MKLLKYVGQTAAHFNTIIHEAGVVVEEHLLHIKPGETASVSDAVGAKLLNRGDFEAVKPEVPVIKPVPKEALKEATKEELTK